MIDTQALIGSWLYDPECSGRENSDPKTAFHFIDDSQLVVEMNLEDGIMVTWYQYWPDSQGILRYPLSKNTRSMFRSAEPVPITVQDQQLIVKGCKMTPFQGRKIPPKFDFSPGSKLDDEGKRVNVTFRSELQPPLEHPPTE